ncbi:MAG: ComF family protein [Bacillota bacterium]
MGIIKSILFNFVYPEKEKCFVCGKDIILAEVPFLCSDCLGKLEYNSNFCSRCGREIEISKKEKLAKNGEKDLNCEFCSKNKDIFHFEKNRSVFVYENLGRELIFHFKYFNKKELYLPLGELLYIYFKEYYSKINFDYIIPIPLFKGRKKERGYNQATLLAEIVAKKSGLDLIGDLLIRHKKTPPLYDLNRSKREALIKGVFSLNEKYKTLDLKNKNILLIDDIFTTGTTTNEASFVFKKEGGVNKVYTLTLASARV